MRNTSPVGWRVTKYQYINNQLWANGNPSIVLDNSTNHINLTLVNFTDSQKLTNYVPNSTGGRSLLFESNSSHYCVSSTNNPHCFNATTSGFSQGTVGVRFKWLGTTASTNDIIFSFGAGVVFLSVYGLTKRLRAYSYGSTALQTYSNLASINSSDWFTAVMTYDKTVDTSIRLYLNGALNSTSITPWSTTYIGASLKGLPFNISNAGVNAFDGLIDYVKVWNFGFATSDVVALHNTGKISIAPNMDYTFDI